MVKVMPAVDARIFLAYVGYYVLKVRWEVDMHESLAFYELLCKKHRMKPAKLSYITQKYYSETQGRFLISDTELYWKVYDHQGVPNEKPQGDAPQGKKDGT